MINKDGAAEGNLLASTNEFLRNLECSFTQPYKKLYPTVFQMGHFFFCYLVYKEHFVTLTSHGHNFKDSSHTQMVSTYR